MNGLKRRIRSLSERMGEERACCRYRAHYHLTVIHEIASRKRPGILKHTPLSKFPSARYVNYDSQTNPAFIKLFSKQGLFHKHTRFSKDFAA